MGVVGAAVLPLMDPPFDGPLSDFDGPPGATDKLKGRIKTGKFNVYRYLRYLPRLGSFKYLGMAP